MKLDLNINTQTNIKKLYLNFLNVQVTAIGLIAVMNMIVSQNMKKGVITVCVLTKLQVDYTTQKQERKFLK